MSLLLRHLETHGLLAPTDLEAAVRRQKHAGGSLDTAILELGLMKPSELAAALQAACGLEGPPLRLLERAPTRPWDHVPKDMVDIGWAIPLALVGGKVMVAIHPDLPDARLGQLFRQVRGFHPVVAPECCLAKVAAERTGAILSPRYAMLVLDYLEGLRGEGETSSPGLNGRTLLGESSGAEPAASLTARGPAVPEDRSADAVPVPTTRQAAQPIAAAAPVGGAAAAGTSAASAEQTATATAAAVAVRRDAAEPVASAMEPGAEQTTAPPASSTAAEAAPVSSDRSSPPEAAPPSSDKSASPEAAPVSSDRSSASGAGPVSSDRFSPPEDAPVSSGMPSPLEAAPASTDRSSPPEDEPASSDRSSPPEASPVSSAEPALAASAGPAEPASAASVGSAAPAPEPAAPVAATGPTRAESAPVASAEPGSAPVSSTSSTAPATDAAPHLAPVSSIRNGSASAAPDAPIATARPETGPGPAHRGRRRGHTAPVEAAAPRPTVPPAQRLEAARTALAQARERDRITEALVRAAAIVAPRVALFGVKREGLRVLAAPGSALRLTEGLVIPLPEGGLLDRAVTGQGPFHLLTEPSLSFAVGQPLGIPCVFEPVLAGGRTVLMLYLDRAGVAFEPSERVVLRELCDIARQSLEALLRLLGWVVPAAQASTPEPDRPRAPVRPHLAAPVIPVEAANGDDASLERAAVVSAEHPESGPHDSASSRSRGSRPGRGRAVITLVNPIRRDDPAPATVARELPSSAVTADANHELPPARPSTLTDETDGDPETPQTRVGLGLPPVPVPLGPDIAPDNPLIARFAALTAESTDADDMSPGTDDAGAASGPEDVLSDSLPPGLRERDGALLPGPATLLDLAAPGAAARGRDGTPAPTAEEPAAAASAALADAVPPKTLIPNLIAPPGTPGAGRRRRKPESPPGPEPVLVIPKTLLGRTTELSPHPMARRADPAPTPAAAPPTLSMPATLIGPRGGRRRSKTETRPPAPEPALNMPRLVRDPPATAPPSATPTLPPGDDPPPVAVEKVPEDMSETTLPVQQDAQDMSSEPSSEMPAASPDGEGAATRDDELDALIAAYLHDPEGTGVEPLRALDERGLARLAARFPGPIDLANATNFPPPSAHGPLLRACVELGPVVSPHVIQAFTSARPQIRFYAAFLFQELRDPRCLQPLGDLAFDPDPDVRLIATRVLESYNRVPQFGAAAARIRGELDSRDRDRQLLAVEAAGTLRDTLAVPRLIDLLAVRDKHVREAALEALCSITAKHHGYRAARWRAWYAEHGGEPRIEWVLDGLRHRDVAVRRWAADELARITGQRIPFPADGDRRARDQALRTWQSWWDEHRAEYTAT